MPQVTLNNFFGLAPNKDAFAGQASVAQNVDLSGGGIKPIKSPSFVESGHYKEFTNFKNVWISGGTNYLYADIVGFPSIIYKEVSGTWKVRVNGDAANDLWITAPDNFSVSGAELLTPNSPALIIDGAGNVPIDTYEYFVTFAEVNPLGTVLRESDASSLAQIELTTDSKISISRPPLSGVLPAGAQWRIYRRTKGSFIAGLVGFKGIWETKFVDDTGYANHGEGIYPEKKAGVSIKYRYVICWVRNLSGWIVESTPSEVYTVDQSAEGVAFEMTNVIDIPPNVTHWRIYRISLGSEPTTTFQLVDEIAVNVGYYLDTKDNVELGAAMQSSYRADNGALVTAGIPEYQFEGMAGPFNGFYVGWFDNDLYLSQQGNPSWFPGAFVVQADSRILGVTQAGNNIAVVTENGVQFGYGVNPDAFALSQATVGAMGVARKACYKNYYLGNDGIYALSENSVELITKDFPANYFNDIEDPILIEEKSRLFLFHSLGALTLDFRTGQWTTLSASEHTFTAVCGYAGDIYGLRDGNIVKLYGGTDDAHYVYAAWMSFSESYSKRVESLRFYGDGQVSVELSSREYPVTIETSDTLNMSSGFEPDRVIYAPAELSTEAILYRLSGNGSVRSIMFEVDKMSTET